MANPERSVTKMIVVNFKLTTFINFQSSNQFFNVHFFNPFSPRNPKLAAIEAYIAH